MLTQRLLTQRFNQYDGININDYLKLDGFIAFHKAITMPKEAIINEIKTSRLTGRGGAGFPTHIKMQAMLQTDGDKILVCNADEGEPGHFKDRYLLEKDPYLILEGILISAYATGASHGYMYIRGEYDQAIKQFQRVISIAENKGYLGKRILNTDFSFHLEIRRGAGAYVCGEEFALMESIEGKPGRTRVKPPYPTDKGVFGKPTLINNVETFCNLPTIILHGGKTYAKVGSELATGTKLICLSGHVKNKGLYEVPYGTPIIDVINKLGNGTVNDIPIQMVQIGGACGPIIPPSLLTMSIDNEAFEVFDAKMGAGAIIVMDENDDLFDIVLRNMTFFLHESCGKCTPCREGHVQLVHLLKKFVNFKATDKDFQSLKSLAEVIHTTTLCGLGQTSPTSIISTLTYFERA
ncbi:MAG: NADH-ubiquinone oxidoreductase-F iron-sulfur binding region domain-containing protein [Candidatus Izemoplasma sp.]|nr:NADH-ubiquinone oxidoreductase-F iron-sulfur binding region domain-containing protein [Candidatus Izemoplasma sp.]